MVIEVWARIMDGRKPDGESVIIGVMLGFAVQVLYDTWRSYYAEVWPSVPAVWANLLSVLLVLLVIGTFTGTTKFGSSMLQLVFAEVAILSACLAVGLVLLHGDRFLAAECVGAGLYFSVRFYRIRRKARRMVLPRPSDVAEYETWYLHR